MSKLFEHISYFSLFREYVKGCANVVWCGEDQNTAEIWDVRELLYIRDVRNRFVFLTTVIYLLSRILFHCNRSVCYIVPKTSFCPFFVVRVDKSIPPYAAKRRPSMC